MATPYPDFEETMRQCHEIADIAPTLVTCEEIGVSEEGRPLPLLTITNPSTSRDDKSVFLLSGGTDGNEEVGRAVSLAMARALLSPQNRTHLQRQVFLIVPNTNPDGCVRDQAGNANGIEAPDVHLPDQTPATAEGRVMRKLVDEWIPDAHVDFHGLAGGSMGDCAYLYPTVNRKWSVPVLMEVAGELRDAGAKAGYPQQGWPRLWWEPRSNLPGWLARNHSTFSMLLEGTENYYPIDDSIRSGVARLMRLIEIGEETRFFQTIPNYPCDVVSGSRMGALMPYGSNYTQRRKSRRDMSQMILEGVPWFGRIECDYDWTAAIHLPIEPCVKTLPEGMVFQATIDRRATIKEVHWQDHKLESELWTTWPSPSGIIVRAEVPESPKHGENQLSIKYDVPFQRHVDRSAE